MDNYSKYIHKSRYARWRDDLGRRETWEETVDRYCDFMLKQAKERTNLSDEAYKELEKIFNESL